jgi:hypothetical protein
MSAEEQGARHLKNAWLELDASEWDRAIESAHSVKRTTPSEYKALLIFALAYEGKGMLKKSQSYLLTYGELMQGLGLHPRAVGLRSRLEDTLGELSGLGAWTASEVDTSEPELERVAVSVRRQRGAFGDGSVFIGGLLGGRGFAQRPCNEEQECSSSGESRPGLWGYSGSGAVAGLSLRAEYFFAGSLVGARLRFDLTSGQPLGHHGVETEQDSPSYRLDAHVVGRIPLTRGRVGVELMPDFTYGLRSFSVFGNVSQTEATVWTFLANQVGGGLGIRIEPLRKLGFEARGGVSVLLKPAAGLTEAQVEAALVLRPVSFLVVRLAGDFRRTTWVFEEGEQLVEVRDLVVGLWAGVGVTF